MKYVLIGLRGYSLDDFPYLKLGLYSSKHEDVNSHKPYKPFLI